jgi:hypothetical protein
MNRTTRSLVISPAMTGLLEGSAIAFVGYSGDKSGRPSYARSTNKHDCKGMNSCKGKGGCKSGDMGCKGKNTCKGKGGCKVS